MSYRTCALSSPLRRRRLLPLLARVALVGLAASACAEAIVADGDAAPCVGAACVDARVWDATSDDALETKRPPDADTSTPRDQTICTVNACGGCATLVGALNGSCGSCGKYVCDGKEALRCDEGGGNACGGCTALSSVPGDACGTCGAYACDGTDAVRCDESGGSNSCGGCTLLGGEAGAACGTCGQGVWTCISANSIVCQNDTLNACGGCAALPADPGDACGACGGGTYACQGTDAVQCNDGAQTNACGGCGALVGTISDPCGTCLNGTLGCSSSKTSLECQGETPCDSCSPAGGSDGNDTLPTATWLGFFDDRDGWSSHVDWLHNVTDVDVYEAHVDDTTFGTMDIVADLDGLSADYDLCVFWERDDFGFTDVYCPDSVLVEFSGLQGCCSVNTGTTMETVTLVDDSGGAGVDDSGTVYYVVNAYDTAIGCFSYELWYAF